MDERIEVISINPQGRYMFLIYGSLDAESLQTISEQICQWWESRSDLIVIGIDKDLKIRIERVDE